LPTSRPTPMIVFPKIFAIWSMSCNVITWCSGCFSLVL
jgi:hypothetical protein